MGKILITGAAGFIGGQLAHKLWQEGKELILVDNLSYGKADNLIFDDINLFSQLIVADILNHDKMEQIFKDNTIDYIYNIAGIAPLPDCQIHPQIAIEVNTVGLVNMLELGRKYGVKTIIQASTNAMYENEIRIPTSENFSRLPSLVYPNTKYCAEQFARGYCDVYGMNVCCLRFANVYGPHIDCLRKQPPFVGYMIRELYYDRQPVFHSDGKQRRDYIYVDDLIDLAIKVQSCKGFDVVNCSSATNYSVKELYNTARTIMGKEHIDAIYQDASHYWDKYPQLFEGEYKINVGILEHEVNKTTLCANYNAKLRYDWSPKVGIVEGLKNVIESTCEMLKKKDNE